MLHSQRVRLSGLFSVLVLFASLVWGGMHAASAAPALQATPKPVDLVLVIDGSGSISPLDFELARTFARSVVVSCLRGADAFTGAVQFSSQATTQIVSQLSDDESQVDARLIGMVQLNGLTDIQEGLATAQSMLAANGRAGTEKIIILLTDGQDNEPGDVQQEASAIRSAGTLIFGVGVGLTDYSELEGIASDPSSDYLYNVSQFAELAAVLDRVVGIACNAPAISLFGAARLDPPAQVAVTLQVDPLQTVAPGGIVTYTIVATNSGDGHASDVQMTVPFNATAVTVLSAAFTSSTAWVSRLGANSLDIRTGDLPRNGGVVTSTLRLQVNSGVASGLAIGDAVSFSWRDDYVGGSGRSNTPFLVTGSSSSNPATVALTVDVASGSASTVRTFSGNFFAPNEPIGLWYNTPAGSAVTVTTTRANRNGELSQRFTPSTLAPGTYSMVAYGHWSKLTAVVTFEVR